MKRLALPSLGSSFGPLAAIFVAACSSSNNSTSPATLDGGTGTPVLDASDTGNDAAPVGSLDAGSVVADAGDGSVTTDGEAGDASAPQAVSISFAAMVGQKPFSCATGTTYANLGTVPSTSVVSDFRFYVHDVSLVSASGTAVPVVLTQDGIWQYENVALLDFENGAGNCTSGTPQTNTAVRGTVTPGTYTGITFKLGVPFSLDHGDPATAPSPLNVDGMTWGWQYGFKYFKIDSQSQAMVDAGLADGGSSMAPVPAFFVHLGATGCVGDPLDGGAISACSNPNLTTVTLKGFDVSTNAVAADFAAIVSYSNLDVNQGGAAGCMSETTDPDCTSIFQAFGLVLSDGLMATPPNQVAFRVQ